MKRLLTALLCLLLSAASCSAEIITRTLPGGATLIVDREPQATQTVIEAFFRVGTADENAVGDSGLSALLARTWTVGSEYRTSFQIARDVNEVGGLGIWTTGEYIELWTMSASADTPDAARTLLMNLVSAPSFPADAVAQAKQAVEKDRAIRQDDLLTDSYTALRRRVFVLSSTGRDPLGDPESLAHATPERLRMFYQRTVGSEASRAVFVVAGNVQPDDAEQMVKSRLAAGDWSALHPTLPARRVTAPDAPDTVSATQKILDLGRPAPTRIVLVGFIAPGTAEGSKTWAAMQLLNMVLAGGKDCRLFALRDHPTGNTLPIGYDVRSRLDAGRQQSLLALYVIGSALPTKDVRSALLGEAVALADGSRPVTEQELIRAKTLLKARHRRERQRLSERASALGFAELSGLGAAFENDYDTRIDAVTLDAVNTLAKRIFSANAATVTTGTEPAIDHSVSVRYTADSSPRLAATPLNPVP